MEYIVWFAVVSGLLVLCGMGLFLYRKEVPLNSPPDSTAERQKEQNEFRLKALNDVPTPWGWPGSPAYGHGASSNGTHAAGSLTIHRWVDGLIAEKQSIHDREYMRRREASLRALLEDRFHSPSHMIEARNGVDPDSPAIPTHSPVGGTQAQNSRESRGKDQRPQRVNGHAKGHSARKTRLSNKPISAVRTPWGW